MGMAGRLPAIPGSRDFRRIWTASVVSQLGDWSGRLAAALVIAERTDNAILIGAVALILAIPHAGPGQILTAVLEPVDRRYVLVGCDLLRALTFFVLGVAELGTAAFLVLLAIAAIADPPFEANISAAVVEATDADELDEAIRLRQLSAQIMILVGYGLGGLAAAVWSSETVLVINAVTFVVSAAILVGVSPRLAGARERLRGDTGRRTNATNTLRSAFAFIGSDPVARSAVAVTAIIVVAGMAVEGQVAILGPDLAGLDASRIGLLAMATPIGTIASVALLGRLNSAGALRRSTVLSVGAALATIALFEFADSFAVLVVAFLVVGVIYQTSVTANIAVAPRVPTDRRATVFGVIQGIVVLAHGLGPWLGGFVIEGVGARRGAQLALASVVLALLFVRSKPTETS